MSITEMVNQVCAWHMVTFPDASPDVVAAKLLEEAFELQDARGDVNVADELADVVLVAFALAGRAGLDLERAVVEKFELNQERAHLGRWA